MRLEDFNKIKKFSEASGSIVVVDDNFKMEINELGVYEEIPINNLVEEISEKALSVSPNFNDKISESMISDKLFKNFDNIKFDSRIGYYLENYVGHVSEGNYREKASSGGFGTWIFAELFNKGLIDGVIHVKKSETDNLIFEYGISRTYEEIRDGSKTKYYPVEFSKVINEVKEKPGRYAFIGIPSFVYSLRLLQEHDEILKDRIKYIIGIICGHQKSTNFSESMAWQMGIKPGDLKDIDFRVKMDNLPANKYGVSVTGIVDGEEKTIIKPNYELFGQDWGHGYFKQVASDFTDDVFNETSDIVLGDAWLPEYSKDYKGNNIIIVRNYDLKNLIENASRDGRLQIDNVSKETIFKSQSSHYKHTHDELSYRLYKEKQKGNWIPKKRVEATDKNIDDTRKNIQDLRQEISNGSTKFYLEAKKNNDFSFYLNSLEPNISKYKNAYLKNRVKNITLKDVLRKIMNKIKK